MSGPVSERRSVMEWLGPCCTHPTPGCVECGFQPNDDALPATPAASGTSGWWHIDGTPHVDGDCESGLITNWPERAIPPASGDVEAALPREAEIDAIVEAVRSGSNVRTLDAIAAYAAAIRAESGRLDVARLGMALANVVARSPGLTVDYSGRSNKGTINESRRRFVAKIATEYARLAEDAE